MMLWDFYKFVKMHPKCVVFERDVISIVKTLLRREDGVTPEIEGLGWPKGPVPDASSDGRRGHGCSRSFRIGRCLHISIVGQHRSPGHLDGAGAVGGGVPVLRCLSGFHSRCHSWSCVPSQNAEEPAMERQDDIGPRDGMRHPDGFRHALVFHRWIERNDDPDAAGVPIIIGDGFAIHDDVAAER